MVDLVQAERPDPGAVARIEVHIGRPQAAVLRNDLPQTALEAKFSAQFAMAAGLASGWIGLRELTDSYVQRPDIQDLMRRVTVLPSDDLDPALPGYARADSVGVVMRDGRRFDSAPVHRPRGHATAPLREDELRAKFTDCLASAGAEAEAAQLYEVLRHLEALPSARALAALRSQARVRPGPA